MRGGLRRRLPHADAGRPLAARLPRAGAAPGRSARPRSRRPVSEPDARHAVPRARRAGAARCLPQGSAHHRDHQVHRRCGREAFGEYPGGRGAARSRPGHQGGDAAAPRPAPGAADRQRRAARRSRPLRDHRRGCSPHRARHRPAHAAPGMAVKSKSMATEEIHLNEALEAAGVTPIETDLGEYIIQLAHERPSHIIAPAIHKTKGQVAELFARELKRETRRRSRDADADRPRRAAREVPAGRPRHHRRELRGGRDGHRGPGHQRGQRPHGDLAAAGARGRDGRGEGRALHDRPRGVPGHPGQERHRPEAVGVHLAGGRPAARRRARGAGGIPPGPARQRADRADRRPAARGALLPALRRLPQRLSRLPADRWPRLRLHLSGAHRHSPDRDARGAGVGEGSRPRLLALRRVRGRLSGADRHSPHADRAAQGGGRATHRALAGAGRLRRLRLAAATALRSTGCRRRSRACCSGRSRAAAASRACPCSSATGRARATCRPSPRAPSRSAGPSWSAGPGDEPGRVPGADPRRDGPDTGAVPGDPIGPPGPAARAAGRPAPRAVRAVAGESRALRPRVRARGRRVPPGGARRAGAGRHRGHRGRARDAEGRVLASRCARASISPGR